MTYWLESVSQDIKGRQRVTASLLRYTNIILRLFGKLIKPLREGLKISIAVNRPLVLGTD